MYILPISNINSRQNTTFQSKYKHFDDSFNLKNLDKQLNKLSKDKDAKKMFTSLSLLAGTLLAEFSLFASKNAEIKDVTQRAIQELGFDKNNELLNKYGDILSITQKNNQDNTEQKELDYKKLFEENPNRNKFLAITSYFPKLDAKYQEMLTKSLTEPDDTTNNMTLHTIESIFNLLSNDDGLKYRKSYFTALDENSYSLNDIAINFMSTILGGDSPMYYLVLLNNGKLSKEDITKWAKYDKLKCDEFMMLKSYDENIIKNINSLKEKNNNFEITGFEESQNAKYINTYFYKLSFPDYASIEDRFKVVTDIHKAIYGDIYVKGTKDREHKFLKADIQTELLDSIVKDSQIDAVYNFVKYINPNVLKNIKLKSDEVKYLDKDSYLYKQIQNICMKALVNIDFESPKMKEMTDLMSNDDIFGNLITTRHARMRFITRFVLKDNFDANITEECKTKMGILTEELNQELDKCNYYCFSNNAGTAPQFYIKNSQLGNYIKITLNDKGTIHTIYEDFKKVQKQNVPNA